MVHEQRPYMAVDDDKHVGRLFQSAPEQIERGVPRSYRDLEASLSATVMASMRNG